MPVLDRPEMPHPARIYVTGAQQPTTCMDYFCKHKLAVIFGTPGAFTPTCTNRHLPGFIENLQNFRSLGVDLVACVTPNDHFVNAAWAQQLNVPSDLVLVSDGNLEFSRGLDVGEDYSDRVMGPRFRRFALVQSEGKILHFVAEKDKSAFEETSAEKILEFLKKHKAERGA